MALFKQFRGNRASLDAQPLTDGYAYFCVDDGTFHIDYADADGNLCRKQINAKDCETIMGISLDELKAEISAQDAVILHEAQTYADAAKAEIQTHLDEQLGDIGAALDGIIAIQDSLIGGTITFTAFYPAVDNGEEVTLTAERGMTWAEFAESEYNDFLGDPLISEISEEDILCWANDEPIFTAFGIMQKATDIIGPNACYYISYPWNNHYEVETIDFGLEFQLLGEQEINLKAVSGMTWGDWIHTAYNDLGGVAALYNDGGDLRCDNGDETVYNSKDERQTLSDVIVEGESYYIQ